VRRIGLVVLLTATTVTSCVGDDGGDCTGAPLAAVEESAAAVRASTCAPSVELDGTTYIQWGCGQVRGGFLGPVDASNAGYIARSIENVPITSALAIRERQKNQEGCRGWQFWADADLLDTNKDAVNDILLHVRVESTLQ
jgi:hypothetical protein